jgi:hypothetical protein
MADQRPPSEIMVGDRFWLAYAQELVLGAVKGPEKRAEQLAVGIGWFWTVYSAAALVVVTVASARPPLPLRLMIAVPSVVLILAYWMASRVRRVNLVEFDPRIPDEIEAAHLAAVREKIRALSWAERLTTLAALSVVAALLSALLIQAPPRVELTVQADPIDPKQLLVLGAMSKDTLVRVTAEAASVPPTAAPSNVVLERTDAAGVLRTRLRTVDSAPVRVTAIWEEDKLRRTASLEFKPVP